MTLAAATASEAGIQAGAARVHLTERLKVRPRRPQRLGRGMKPNALTGLSTIHSRSLGSGGDSRVTIVQPTRENCKVSETDKQVGRM